MTDAIRQVARGDRPWTDLNTFGLELNPEAGRAENLPPTNARVTAHDLASGFQTHRHDPNALRHWAFVMEAVDADFEDVEAHPQGEVVFTALRNASFGEPLSSEEVAVLVALAQKDEHNT